MTIQITRDEDDKLNYQAMKADLSGEKTTTSYLEDIRDDSNEARRIPYDKSNAGIFFIGVGDGSGIRYAHKHLDDRFPIYVLHYDKPQLAFDEKIKNKRVKYFCGEHDENVDFYRANCRGDHAQFIIIESVRSRFEKEHLDVHPMIEWMRVIAGTSQHQFKEFTEMMKMNAFINIDLGIHHGHKAYRDLWDTADDMTPLVLGAGPSLEMLPKFLEGKDRNKYLVIACAQTAKYLNAQQILADYAVYIDFHPLGWEKHYDLGLTALPGAPLITCLECYTEIVSLYGSEVYMGLNENYRWMVDLTASQREQLIRAFGSYRHHTTVMSYAIDVAMRIGYTDIHTFGLDLGKPKDKAMHIEGYSKDIPDHINEYEEIGVTGEICETNMIFKGERDYYVWLLRNYPEIKMTNHSWGLKIKGAENV